MHHYGRILIAGVSVAAFLSSQVSKARAQNADDLKNEIEQLREQNHLLQKQLGQQQEMIDQLSRKLSGLEITNQQRDADWQSLKADVANAPPPLEKTPGFSLGNVVISGEGGAGFFETQRNGQYPNAAFRVDEARLFVDAPIWQDVYFYGELDLQTREQDDEGLYLGELYLEWENVLKHWDLDQLVNLRVGQFYIPFGEEYLSRFAIDNALISHSLSDLWGLNPGLELFGGWRHLTYVAAVQDGGISTLNDFTADKSVAGRIGYDPLAWLHFSVSGMRTGRLSVSNDVTSGLWFGDGFFQSIGSPATSVFQANLAEIDGQAKWRRGYVRAAGGYADYDDNDPTRANHRDIYYYYIEALQHLSPKLYAAARWSQIRAPGGYPIVADSPTSGLPTTDLWRLSLGLGYQFNSHLVLKAEYMFENGKLATGGNRDHEDMFSAEATFRF